MVGLVAVEAVVGLGLGKVVEVLVVEHDIGEGGVLVEFLELPDLVLKLRLLQARCLD